MSITHSIAKPVLKRISLIKRGVPKPPTQMNNKVNEKNQETTAEKWDKYQIMVRVETIYSPALLLASVRGVGEAETGAEAEPGIGGALTPALSPDLSVFSPLSPSDPDPEPEPLTHEVVETATENEEEDEGPILQLLGVEGRGVSVAPFDSLAKPKPGLVPALVPPIECSIAAPNVTRTAEGEEGKGKAAEEEEAEALLLLLLMVRMLLFAMLEKLEGDLNETEGEWGITLTTDTDGLREWQ